MGRMSAREIAEQITKGRQKPEHLGKKTPQVLAQEIFSILNTKEAFRGQDWKTAVFIRKKELLRDYNITKWQSVWNRNFK